MHRKPNVKLIVGTLAVLLVASISVHFLHGYQVARNAHRLRERGDQAVLEKNLDKAIFYYAQYLSFAPNDVDALQQYALALDRRGEASERVRLVLLMEQVLRVKADEHELRYRLVHNLIALDRIPEALDNVKRLVPHWGDKAEILHLLGWCQDAKKEYAAAAESFAEAIRANKKQIHTYALLAEVLDVRLHEPEEAQKVLADLVAENAAAHEAYLVRSHFARRRGDEASAQRDLNKAYELAPGNARVILALADAARARGDWPEATRLLKEGMKRFPSEADFYKEMASVKIGALERGEAISYLKDAIRHAPKSNELAVLLVDVLIDERQYREARTKIDELVKAGMKPALPNYLRARLLIADGDWPAAIRLLECVEEDLGPGSDWSSRIHVLLGLCHRQLGNGAEELKSLRRAVNAEPAWLTANLELGAALLNNRLLNEAINTLEPMRTAKDVPAGYWILLSRARLLAQMRLPAADREWDAVEAALAKANPKDAEAVVVRAELAAVKRDFAGVRDYRDALWLARVYQLAGNNASADKLLRQAIDDGGHTPDAWLAWIDHLQFTDRHDEALRELERLKKELPANRQPLTIARCYEALQMPEEARKAYEAALKANPDDLLTLTHAADFARRAGRHEEARGLYERLLDPQLAAPATYADPARKHLASLKSRS